MRKNGIGKDGKNGLTTDALVCGTMTVHIIGVPWHSFNKDRLLHTVVIFGAFFGLMLIHDMLQARVAALSDRSAKLGGGAPAGTGPGAGILAQVEAAGAVVRDLKDTKAGKDEIKAAVEKLLDATDVANYAEKLRIALMGKPWR